MLTGDQPSDTESVPIGSKSVVGAETPVACPHCQSVKTKRKIGSSVWCCECGLLFVPSPVPLSPDERASVNEFYMTHSDIARQAAEKFRMYRVEKHRWDGGSGAHETLVSVIVAAIETAIAAARAENKSLLARVVELGSKADAATIELRDALAEAEKYRAGFVEAYRESNNLRGVLAERDVYRAELQSAKEQLQK